MGKTGSSTSWLTAVKKVFRSPTKTPPTKNCKRREEHAQEDDEDRKKTEKRRWIFRKLASNNSHQYEVVNVISNKVKEADMISMDMQRSAIAAAEASTAAAKAAVATAQAAVRVHDIIPAYLAREYYAALIIQTAFRGYLARRALRALKGIVKLQAIVRGHNMRKQAKATLKCMQSLIRVQAKLCDPSFSRPLSHGGSLTRNSMYAESNNLWDKYKDIQRRKSLSQNENSIEDQCNVNSYNYTIEDIDAILQSKKEASLCREQALAYALSEQIRRFDRKICPEDEEEEEKQDCQWLSQWLDSRQYKENNSRLTTNRKEAIKNVDLESLQPHFRTPTSLQRTQHRQDSPSRRHSLHVARSLNNVQPMTPPPRDTKPLQAQTASPRAVRSHSAATTPSLRTGYRHSRTSPTTTTTATTTPSYMAATESAKARARTQSTPRQRHSTSDRERGGSVRKRLSYPIPEPQYPGRVYNDYSSCFSQNLRSPSFRSVQEGLYHIERGTTCSSYTDITGGDISPASTSHLRRWLS